MKISKLIFVLLILVAGVSIDAKAQDVKTEQFLKTAFGSFKAKDSSKFKTLFPDYATFTEIMNNLMASGSNTPKFTEADYQTEITGKEVKKFMRTLSAGEDFGVVWEKAIFESYTISKKEKTPGDMEDESGEVVFSCNGNKYKLPFKNVIRYKDAFYGFSFKKIYKLVDGKYLDAQGDEEIN